MVEGPTVGGVCRVRQRQGWKEKEGSDSLTCDCVFTDGFNKQLTYIKKVMVVGGLNKNSDLKKDVVAMTRTDEQPSKSVKAS